MNNIKTLTSLLIASLSTPVFGQAQALVNAYPVDSVFVPILNQVNFRMIGPATTSGRVIDLLVNPTNKAEIYVAAAYGGVWKSQNGGTTFDPVFDKYGTQSIGCLAMDPKNSNIVWVGTGENNNQRSVGYGNGLYKSVDGGKNFENVGLKLSEHIGMIKIDPSNSNRVWVAVYGPVWKEGGERGLYKTEDGGITWERIKHVSDNTGCNEVHLDPSISGTLYAAFHQRRRHEWTYLGGGPESALYKSTDNGKTWKKLGGGLPSGDLGRITMAVSSLQAGLVYAMIEAEEGGGIYVSHDYGESWTKQNSFFTAGNYYQELFIDPCNARRIFIMDTYLKVSDDAGKTLRNAGEGSKHVDNHVIWVDPSMPSHWLVGCDGGLYETYDNAQHWNFKENLSITQFYRVSVDNASPFYNIYGGTQDNNTLGGPSRNNSANGIGNDEWYITVGGDGFKSQIDPTNPDIVYSQWQYGGLVRYDKKTGEAVDIKPSIELNEPPLRWNWDAPLLISRFNPKKLYFAANRVFMSEDRGDSWKPISNDLSRGIDRNTLPIMGKVWGLNAVVKNQSTSIYGNITTMSEGKDGVLFVGTDDGMVWRTTDDGLQWTQCGQSFPEGPKAPSGSVGYPFISAVYASNVSNVLYVVLDNHRMSDFAPYAYKSTNNGTSWIKIGKGLPLNGPVKTILEDFKDKDIVLVGTEFGLFISINGGNSFQAWKGGLPPIAIKDMVFQEREDDLVLATFGRGFAVCDDYQVIRDFKEIKTREENEKGKGGKSISATKTSEGLILPIADAPLFIPATPLGGGGNAHHGASRFAAENPSIGAVIFYSIHRDFTTIASRRKKRETDAAKLPNTQIYPIKDSIVAEALFESPRVYMVVRNTVSSSSSAVIAKWVVPAVKGMAKTVWNLRYTDVAGPISTDKDFQTSWGPYVNSGDYWVSLEIQENGKVIELAPASKVHVQQLYQPTIAQRGGAEKDKSIADMFSVKRRLGKANLLLKDIEDGINASRNAAGMPMFDAKFLPDLERMKDMWNQLNISLNGNSILATEEFETHDGLNEMFASAYHSCMDALNAPTLTHIQKIERVGKKLDEWDANANTIIKIYASLAAGNPQMDFPALMK
ncbi:MAG: glycosyl hydrolase [Flavobacteriaceae bacterium]|nr:glycosyl hydrolase [Flavobacteriaceae bacterium]